MSAQSDRLEADVLAVVYRHTGVTKGSGQHAVLEAVVGGLCTLIGRYEDHIERTNTMLSAMTGPVGPMMPGPGPIRSRPEPFTPDEWQMMRIRQESRYE